MAKWTEERRKKQAEAIRRWKPWEKSTGPRTEAGKERSKLNAWQGSYLREAEKMLALSRAFMEQSYICMEVGQMREAKRELLKIMAKQCDDQKK